MRKNKNAKYFTDVINDEINNKWKSLIFKEFLKKKGNVVITPHIGGMTLEAQQIAFNAAADHLINLHKNDLIKLYIKTMNYISKHFI